ncbi:hypothetical protein ACSBR1_039824 [Camellia fascicularis]
MSHLLDSTSWESKRQQKQTDYELIRRNRIIYILSAAADVSPICICSKQINWLLAREGINAEQLARDLKSFELKMTFEDVFPAEATIVEEYL